MYPLSKKETKMSAFMCGKSHIIFLVEAGLSLAMSRGDGGQISWYHDDAWKNLTAWDSDEKKTEVAQMLWDENLKSVTNRYPKCTLDNMPGSVADAKQGFKINPNDFCQTAQQITPVQVLKSCACYEYQTCEHQGYKSSEAKAFIEALKTKAVNSLEGYEDAVWGAPA
jgi:hypothetical protein